MARTVKAAAERRAEIVRTARALFFEHGYEATSVQRVINAVGVSKGAFYHHFPSKEALLEAVALALAEAGLSALAERLDAVGDDPIERLAALFATGRATKQADAVGLVRLSETLYQPGNLALRTRLAAATRAAVAPVYEAIVAGGIASGVFDCGGVDGIAGLLLGLGDLLRDDIAEALAGSRGQTPATVEAALTRCVRRHDFAVNRLLGLTTGTVGLYDAEFITALSAAAHAAGPHAKGGH